MKHWMGLLFMAGLMVWVVAALPVNPAAAAPVAPGLSASVAPAEIIPGQAGYVHVSGGYPLAVTVTMDGQPLDIFWAGSGYEGLFSFGLDAQPGEHMLAIDATNLTTGETLSRTETVTVTAFDFRNEQVSIPYRLQDLLDPKLNQSELDRLSAVYAGRTQPARLDWPFAIPVPGGIVTSRFGGNRVYNGGVLAARHAGVDFRRAIGEPVLATADGRVALADTLSIRGNVIVLDHGYGVFSQYAHLSQILVQPNQFVRRGEVIGLAGATGRANGPHLHFEVIVNGNPVDPLKWLALAPGFIPPREATPIPQTDGSGGGDTGGSVPTPGG